MNGISGESERFITIAAYKNFGCEPTVDVKYFIYYKEKSFPIPILPVMYWLCLRNILYEIR